MSGPTVYPRFRASPWIDTNDEAMKLPKARILYGVQAQAAKGGPWMHCQRGSEALIFETLEECGAEIKRLSQPAPAPTLYMGPPVTVTFKDEGQDFLEWDIRDGHVVACRPFQASIWVGREVHSTPIPRKQLQITGHDGALMWIKYPLTKVKALAEQVPDMPSKAVRNSKVVTAGAKALLASHKARGGA